MKEYLAGPNGAAEQRVSRASGVWLRFADGRQVLDAASGAVVVNIGYGRTEVVGAVADSLSKLSYAHPAYLTNERAALCDTLREQWLPRHLDRMLFSCGGGEAIDHAMKLALLYQCASGHPHRNEFLALTISYHGATLAAGSVGGQRCVPQALQAYRRVTALPNCRCNTARSPAAAVCSETLHLDKLERTFGERAHPFAALIAEPVVTTSGGVLIPCRTFWNRLQALCRRHGILLIVDEIMTGFGRTGVPFACEHYDLKPDVLVAGKGLACGYAPICGVFTTAAIMESLRHAGYGLMTATYAAHPASCAAATAVLAILRGERLVERAASLGAHLGTRLQSLRGHPEISDVRGVGMLWAVEFSEQQSPQARRLRRAQLLAGVESFRVALYPAGVESDRVVLVVAPPFTLDEDGVERIVAAIRSAASSKAPRSIP
jgi:adenosylmethionine-8-amino-7-oxononanoate aminotransferase